ncbi:hypothetical protein FPZ43_05125 [Mucilaginibacter pallidiroseus]|uniref:Uncharacterized protein n=1 Tax=Mucilaginibacter pallidiroseus TaxID=2599295 RepID=A0A563UG47_9SPHI|nr:hypothetical protein [Mucilaginibacter pallidiroseus]TWR30324.1 hypothetical protein FPZ43_05125 [Mucilaginibacter pallidiroseus]
MPHRFYSNRSKLKRIPVYYLLVIIGSLFPLFLASLAGYIAKTNCCTLSEAGAHPCFIDGTDIGELLSIMFGLGWMMLATIPTGICLFLVLTYYTIHDILYYKRNPDSDYDAWIKKIKTDL